MKTRLQKNINSKKRFEKSISIMVLFLSLVLITPSIHAQLVSRLAGSLTQGYADGTGTLATFNTPYGLAVDASGNIYVADRNNQRIRKITPAGVVTTLAGGGPGLSTDGTGTAASFQNPSGLVVDAAGNIYVTDTGNNKIRKITSAGVVTTFAGSGSPGSADATGTSASFNAPLGITIDGSGNLFVADTYNNKIRKITSAGVVTTFAGSGSFGSADGTGTAASFYYPYSLVVDGTGTIFVSDTYNQKIRKITSAGVVTTLAGSGTAGSANGTGTSATFSGPIGIGIDGSGNLFVADHSNHKIRKITSAGVVTNYAGSGTGGSTDALGTAARFYNPYGIAIDGSGNIFVSDVATHIIRKITPVSEIKISQGATELVSGTGSYNFGNINMLSSSTAISFTIENVAPSEKPLTLTGSPTVTISGTNAASFTVNTTSTTSNIAGGATTSFTITFSPTISGTNIATVTVLNDDTNEGTYTFTIWGTGVKLNQTITGFSNQTQIYGDASFTLAAGASSSLPLSYSYSNPSVASVSGTTVSILAAGSTTITVSQSGNVNYNPASDINFTITVSKAPLTITANNQTKLVGDVNPALTISYLGFKNGDDETVLGCTVVPQTTADASSLVGTYPITITDCGYTNANYSYTFVDGTLNVLITNSTEESKETQLFSISPNPTNGQLFVMAKKDLQFDLYDTKGMKESSFKVSEGNSSISLENLKSGIYIIHCIDENSKHQKIKIIKN